MREPGAPRAVTPAVALVLLALADRPRHGYAIRAQIEKLTDGRTRMGSGTFYRSIQRMTVSGWVRRLDHLADAADEDERRIYYELTALGRRAAVAEARRLADLVGAAIARGLLPGGRPLRHPQGSVRASVVGGESARGS